MDIAAALKQGDIIKGEVVEKVEDLSAFDETYGKVFLVKTSTGNQLKCEAVYSDGFFGPASVVPGVGDDIEAMLESDQGSYDSMRITVSKINGLVIHADMDDLLARIIAKKSLTF